jgi:ligand-binding sensor domain-containing protein
MLNDDGNIWIGSDGGLSIFNPATKKFQNETTDTLLLDQYITDIEKGVDGSIWIATQGEGLLRYDSGRWSIWANSVGLPHQWITQCLLNPNGDLWVGTHSGLSLLDYKHLKIFDGRDGLTHNLTLDLAGNDHGEIWIGTQGKGVFYFDGWGFEQITVQDGLPHDHAQTLHVDKATGNIWVGTVLGIAELKGNQVVGTYLDSSDQAGEVTDVRDIKTGPDETIWMASWKSGLMRLDKNTRGVKSFGANQGLGNALSLSLAISREGIIYVGTEEGLFILDEGKPHIPEAFKELRGERIEDVEFDAAGDILYIVSSNGIFQFTPATGVSRISPIDSLIL